MSHSAGSTVSAVLEEAKAARWGTFQRVCGCALERLGGLNTASASLLDMRLDFSLGCVLIAQSHSWELLLCLKLLDFLQVSCSLITPSLQSRSKVG